MTWETKWRADMGEKGRGRHRREEGDEMTWETKWRENMGEKWRGRHGRKRERR